MIDWFTVIAQIVNFLILVALLRYFLYGRVLAAMDKRQQEIAGRWQEANEQREEAANELEVARQKHRVLDQQREHLLSKVQDEIELHRQQLTAKVRGEVDELRERWSDSIQEETESFLRDLGRRASEQVCAIARRALADLAGASLEQQIVDRFINQVKRLDDGARQAIIASLREGDCVAIVQTSYELPDDQQVLITSTLREQFLDDLEVLFEQSSDLLCGIALQTDAHKLAWSLRDYLISLEQDLQQSIEDEASTSRTRQRKTVDVET